jgi:hypothetical protein
MEMPSVVHPTSFNIRGIYFRVVTLFPLTDQQAAKIAMRYYRAKKFKKKDIGSTIHVISVVDRESIELL